MTSRFLCGLLASCRDATTFSIPNSDIAALDLSHVRVFATMNPASVGGGRSRLPRSLRNLFTSVTLQKPDETEVKSIALDIFSSCLDRGLIDQQHATCLLCFHQVAVTAAERRDLGRAGAATEFNLRDLIKVRDIMLSNMSDELHHIQLEAAAAAAATASNSNISSKSAAGSSWVPGWVHNIASKLGSALGWSTSATASRRAASSTDLRLQVLCKVLSSVYASRFPSKEDQDRVQQLIAKHMQVEEHDLIRDWDSSLECSIPATLRIGAVFLTKGAARTASSASNQALSRWKAALGTELHGPKAM